MGFTDPIFHLIIGFVTGIIGINYGALYAGVGSSWKVAAVTALAGAVVWMVASIFMGWIPFIGSFGTLAVWIFTVSTTYSVAFGTAFEIAIFAWLASFIVVHIESFLGFRHANALGVPGE